MKYGAALVVMAIGEQGRAVTSKDKVTRLRSLTLGVKMVVSKNRGFSPRIIH